MRGRFPRYRLPIREPVCPAPVICTCEHHAEDARATSFLENPFITESTTISAATPSAMPSIEVSE